MTLSTECLSILQLSDTHILATPSATLLGVDTAYYFRAVLAQAFAERKTFDLIMLTGDIAQQPVMESYQYVLEHITGYGTPCVCLPGNHDDYALMQKILNTRLVNCRKQLFLKNWQIISLNSQIIGEEGGFLPSEELAFLDRCLSQYPGQYALIAVHHHVLATESVWMDTMMITNSGDFLALVGQYPQAKVVLNGHIHQSMDKQTPSLRVLGTPSTCFQFKPKSVEFALDDASPAYRHIQLYPDGRVSSQVSHLLEPLIGLDGGTNGY
ncbi:MAG: 3',5'-cyclic-AMP phosphodiesterase [Methylovulum sp.]|uniref:3',5'-cyclic-AMP phosphodiesterase n=1 Tax=Methylovulum sp. TaxID=1916980 RepID=UPI0026055645|nr:3',5'-cyclic-AMP phosphodiesterase [Methylovulum sp.]MDD2725095.1 3',5'-cyclic-AMP phosphodiesterase [Methylovulum sp.]MDD5124143.1 3',5'-cyclic-AMP phosphodiesterase [Methylovulum sp.]